MAVEDRILLHLLEQLDERDRYIVSRQVTRRGIAEACGLHPPNVSRSMKALERRHLVKSSTASVRQETRRQKAWHLTEDGEKYAHERRKKLGDTMILIRDGRGRLIEVPAKEVGGRLDANMELFSILMYAAAEGVLTYGDVRFGPIHRTDRPEPGRLILLSGAHATYDINPPEPRRVHGRENELELIDNWLDGTNPALVVHGIAGIGKSTLVAHWLTTRRPHEVEYSLCWYPTQPWDTPVGLATSLLHRLNVSVEKDPYHLITSLPQRPGQDFDIDAFRRRLSAFLVDSSTQADRHRPKMREKAGEEGLPRPLIWLFVFDDIHHLDDNGMAMLGALLQIAEKTPLRLILISRTRPTFYDRRDVHIRDKVTEIALDGLTPDEIEDWMTNFDEELTLNASDLHERTAGHPLALELLELYGSPTHPDWRSFLDVEVLEVLPTDERMLLAVLAESDRPVEWDILQRAASWEGPPPERLLLYGLLYETDDGFWMHEAIRDRLLLAGPQTRTKNAELLQRSIEEANE